VSIESVERDKRRKYRDQPTTPGRILYCRSVYFCGAGHKARVPDLVSKRDELNAQREALKQHAWSLHEEYASLQDLHEKTVQLNRIGQRKNASH
jgi:hypothetical protein